MNKKNFSSTVRRNGREIVATAHHTDEIMTQASRTWWANELAFDKK
jgi:hypothetical protein